MKKYALITIFLFVAAVGFAQNTLSLEISDVKVNGGKLYVSLFNSEQSYKEKKIFLKLELEPTAEKVPILLKLSDGEYFFSIYQDANKNGKLDVNLIGIPKEAFGFSNYDGKNIPGNFDLHKVLVSPAVKKVNVQLYKI